MQIMAGIIRVMIPLLMTEKGISRGDLAEALHISPATATDVKLGRRIPRTAEELARLCDLFSSPPGDIYVYTFTPDTENGDR